VKSLKTRIPHRTGVLTPFRLLRNSGRVLLEAAPEGMSVEEIGRAIAAHLHVENVHELHVWQISSGFPSLSAHVLVHPGDDCHGIRRELEHLLDERFAIDHTNLQDDHAPEPGLVRIGATPTTRHEH
jgi:cobalt-zinc-cadmium efflux system protein